MVGNADASSVEPAVNPNLREGASPAYLPSERAPWNPPMLYVNGDVYKNYFAGDDVPNKIWFADPRKEPALPDGRRMPPTAKSGRFLVLHGFNDPDPDPNRRKPNPLTDGRLHLTDLFPGMELGEAFVFRVTRDSEFELDEDVDDLLRAIEASVKQRRRGHAVRLEIEADAPAELEQFGFEAEMGGQRVKLEYFIARQPTGGATLAARLTANDLAALTRDVERIAGAIPAGAAAGTRYPEAQLKGVHI